MRDLLDGGPGGACRHVNGRQPYIPVRTALSRARPARSSVVCHSLPSGCFQPPPPSARLWRNDDVQLQLPLTCSSALLRCLQYTVWIYTPAATRRPQQITNTTLITSA